MSHPLTTFDWTEKHRAENPKEYALRKAKGERKKVMNPIIHTDPIFKEARKSMQGINSTLESSKEKSFRRNEEKKQKSKLLLKKIK